MTEEYRKEFEKGLAYLKQLLEGGKLSPARRRLVENEIRTIEHNLGKTQ